MNEDPVIIDFSDFLNRNSPKTSHRKSYYGRIEEYTIDGIFIRNWESAAEAAECYNVSNVRISECVRGRTPAVYKIQRIFIREGESIIERLNELDEIETNSKNKPSKVAVDEYDIKGNYIKSYDSISAINDACPDVVRKVCTGKILFSKIGKRIFLYKGSSINERLELIKQEKYNSYLSKSINEYNKNGSKIITVLKHWKSVSDITAEYGISPNKILDCCFGNINYIKNKIFLFSGDSIKKRLKVISSKNK